LVGLFHTRCLPRPSPPFPYTTLFRSAPGQARLGPSECACRYFHGHATTVNALCPRSFQANCKRCWLLRRNQFSTRQGHPRFGDRSEEHTSELQSLRHLVCRLLLEKKK